LELELELEWVLASELESAWVSVLGLESALGWASESAWE
jgi:hypothetical protein